MKFIFIFFGILFINFGFSLEENQEILRQKHLDNIHFYGDDILTEGDHYFEKTNKSDKNSRDYSVYKYGDTISRYSILANKEYYYTLQVILQDTGTAIFNFNHRIICQQVTYSVKYTVTFEKTNGSTSAKYQLHIDERGSVLPDDCNFSIVTKCIFDHGFPLAPGIFNCLISKDQNKESKRNCLFNSLEIKEIENILQCIHNKNS